MKFFLESIFGIFVIFGIFGIFGFFGIFEMFGINILWIILDILYFGVLIINFGRSEVQILNKHKNNLKAVNISLQAYPHQVLSGLQRDIENLRILRSMSCTSSRNSIRFCTAKVCATLRLAPIENGSVRRSRRALHRVGRQIPHSLIHI